MLPTESIPQPHKVYADQALWYPAQTPQAKGTLLYYHGGGLIFGQPNDLPPVYIHLLTQAGYHLLAFDYPLFPEHDIATIIAAAQAGLDWYLDQGYQLLGQVAPAYCLFGRSAGAYLALYLTAHTSVKPLATISLYGYSSLSEASFSVPNRHYLQFPKLADTALNQLLTKSHPTADDRYLIYLSLRQRGNWIKLLAPQTDLKAYQVHPDQLAQFPPTFIAAAEHDPDVPSRQSHKMAQVIPLNQLTIVASADHDFDRTQIDTLGLPLYQDLIRWLEQNFSAYAK